MEHEKESEDRIQNSEYPMPEVRGFSKKRIFSSRAFKIGGFKPRFSIQLHRIHAGFWLLNSEFFFGKYGWKLIEIEPTPKDPILKVDCVFAGKTEFPKPHYENEKESK